MRLRLKVCLLFLTRVESIADLSQFVVRDNFSLQAVEFDLTNIGVPFSCPALSPIFLVMKKALFLSILTCLAIICSCQKQDSGAEAQLAQRKTELDAREETLIQREKAVEEREKAVAERERTLANSRIIQSPRQAPNAAQAEAEREKRLQQLPPELRALIPNRSQIDAKAERDRAQAAQTQRSSQDSRKKGISGIAPPQPQFEEAEAASPSPSPTPE